MYFNRGVRDEIAEFHRLLCFSGRSKGATPRRRVRPPFQRHIMILRIENHPPHAFPLARSAGEPWSGEKCGVSTDRTCQNRDPGTSHFSRRKRPTHSHKRAAGSATRANDSQTPCAHFGDFKSSENDVFVVRKEKFTTFPFPTWTFDSPATRRHRQGFQNILKCPAQRSERAPGPGKRGRGATLLDPSRFGRCFVGCVRLGQPACGGVQTKGECFPHLGRYLEGVGEPENPLEVEKKRLREGVQTRDFSQVLLHTAAPPLLKIGPTRCRVQPAGLLCERRCFEQKAKLKAINIG
jgi:hypothetical protein